MSSTASCPAPGSATTECTLLLADVVDSTTLADRLDAAELAAWWQAHDGAARALLRTWHGREIDKSDGFLLLFETVDDALAYAADYHRAIAGLVPEQRARVAVHRAEVVLRENTVAEVAMGAKPLEVDGLGKSLAARLMALAQGGQTLMTASTAAAISARDRLQRQGHWRLKGMAEPVEVVEYVDPAVPCPPPIDGPKAYRVVQRGQAWMPVADLPHTLPAEPDRMLGREAELRDVFDRYDCGARLVTVLGLGGAGKTRLAVRFGWAWRGEFPGGVWFCDLSQASSVDGLLHAVAQGLELPLGRGEPVKQVGQAIGARGRCLVILDNFEQVVGHAPATLGRWIEQAGEAAFLATSRELLGLAGEQALALPPLPQDQGLALFIERARAADAAFQPCPADERVLAELVTLLDGLPLAIELCAARVTVMPAQALLQHMAQRFRLLVRSSGVRDRRATLRATLDGSWDLLDAAERAALAQLAVFERGFTLEAALAVIDLGAAPDAPWAVDVVQSLVHKSLVRKLEGARFELLRTVQDYALERLPAADAATTETAACRHWRYWSASDARLATAGRCVEADNLVAACRRACAAGDSTAATPLLVRAWSALRRVGPYGVAVDLAQQVESAAAIDPAALVRARIVHANALAQLGQRRQARAVLAGTAAPADPDTPVHAELACIDADQLAGEGQFDAARQLLERARAIAQRHGDVLLECRVLNSMGALDHESNRMDEADRNYRAALALARDAGDVDWQAMLWGNIGALAHAQGLWADALQAYEQTIALARQEGDRRWEGNGRSNLGWLHHEAGHTEAAQRELWAALAIAQHLGSTGMEAAVRCNLGVSLMSAADGDAALVHLERAVRMVVDTGDAHAEGQYRTYLASAQAALGNRDAATAQFDAAESILNGAGDPNALGILMCRRAMASLAAGADDEARNYLKRARALAAQAGVSPRSEFGRLLVSLGRA
jgi:predicted ATPase/class 3 adenylate cyclase/Tfp pilus assembly protein PilF